MKVAALFVANPGAYVGLPDVDPWDKARDARNYDGPHPVVAHPPCQLWVNFAALNYQRYGGGHNRPGNDHGCFESALRSVRRWGGVLELPAGSNAWRAFDLVDPTSAGPRRWKQAAFSEWTCEVWQSAYGHKARKRTWLLYVGAERPPALNWSRTPFDRIKPTLSKQEASATPLAFRDILIGLALGSVNGHAMRR